MLGFLFGLVFGAFFAMLYDLMYGKSSRTLDGTTGRSLALKTSPYSAASAIDRSGSFLTDLIASIWSQVNMAVSTEVKNTVEPMFKEMLPGPLKTLHFTKLSLGDVPLRLDNCIVHECKTNMVGKKYVQIEIDVVWDGECDIELKADYVGKLGVKSLKLAGRLSLLLQPVIETIPVVGAVQFGFVNPPVLELDFTGIANVADISSIKTTINTTIADILAGMLVLPNRMMSKLDESISYFSVYQPPLGVARLTLLRGRGFKVEERTMRSNDIPDVYCTVSIGATDVWTTSVVKNSVEPVWDGESADAFLDDYDQIITIKAFDKDEGTMDTDDPLGAAQLTVGEILLAGNTKEVELQDEGGKGSGAFLTLHCELLNLVADTKSINEQLNGGNEKMFNGVLTILLSQASGIPDRSDPDVPEMYFVKASFGKKTFFSAAVDGQVPVYDTSFRIPLLDESKHPIVISLFKGANATEDGKDNELVGEFQVLYESVMDSVAYTISSSRQVCEAGPSVEYSISVCGLAEAKTRSGVHSASALPLPAATNGPDKGTPVDVTIEKGWGFKAESRGLRKADIPDTYVKLTFGSSPRIWRTKTIKNNFTPFWQETQTFEMVDHSQIINVEAWDEDGGSNDPDDLLGSARITVGKILLAGGSFDVELLQDGAPSGTYVTLRCGMSTSSSDADGNDKAEETGRESKKSHVAPSIPAVSGTEPEGWSSKL